MSFHSNLDTVLAALKTSKQQALQNIGTACTANVQLIEPVKTGNMRRSTTSQIVSDSEVAVGVTHDADYALYVDQGTSKQPAQHFLENGVQQSISQIQDILQNAYGSNIGR